MAPWRGLAPNDPCLVIVDAQLIGGGGGGGTPDSLSSCPYLFILGTGLQNFSWSLTPLHDSPTWLVKIEALRPRKNIARTRDAARRRGAPCIWTRSLYKTRQRVHQPRRSCLPRRLRCKPSCFFTAKITRYIRLRATRHSHRIIFEYFLTELIRRMSHQREHLIC